MKPLIFIAGGSQGLGQALCQKYILNNWDVVELSRSGRTPNNVTCDFNNVSAVNDIFKKLFTAHKEESRPEIQLIINTASLSPFGNIAESNTAEISTHLNVNVHSAILLIHQFSSAFQKHPAKKTLGYISSGAARRSIEGMALYCASKAALEHFVLTFNLEQQRQNTPIEAMVINPGVMDTKMQADIRKQTEKDFPMVDTWRNLYDNKQLADVNDIAQICHQLMQTPDFESPYQTAQSYLK